MPKVEFKHVVSFSSEDSKNPAENLLKPEAYYKWKTDTKGEQKAVVVLQLEKATQIHSIDIGNNGSAFVEVLTGRSSWDPNEDYKVLLVASSFMSPAESKSGTNQMRVRMFGAESLNKAVANEKWDRIKVICTQPYNKDEAYGLSFIQLHSPPADDKKEESKNDQIIASNLKTKIGRFTLKEDSDKDEISIGSYFAKKSLTSSSASTTSLAASARDATSKILSGLVSSSTSSSSSKTTHSTSFTPKRDFTAKAKMEGNEKTISGVERTSAYTIKPQYESSKRKIEENKKEKDASISATVAVKGSNESNMPPSKKLKISQRPRKNRNLPFHKLMRKVVFALSGFKNPERGNIRDKAISMGAEYRPDWGSGCTHLVCAFKNTPKFNQVKGKGKIVNEKWIIECAKRKERLPIKQYRIDDGSSSSDFDSDVSDKECLPDNNDSSEKETATKTMSFKDELAEGGSSRNIVSSYNDDAQPGPSHFGQESDDAEYDTEDELKRARLAIESSKDEDDDIYGGSTEDESDKEAVQLTSKESNKSPELPELPDYFDGKHFLLYGKYDPRDRRLLSRYITAYNGIVEDYMSDDVNFVVSNDEWDENFEKALTENSSLEFVKPKWIFKCHEMRNYLPFEQYKIQRDNN